MNTKPVFLDVDPSIVERNLKLTQDNDSEIDKLFSVPHDHYPSKLVKPVPGFCVKSREIGTGEKVFVNVCKTDAIPPPPKELSEGELAQILDTDEVTEFKVPMSIGDMRSEKDKKGGDAKVCDVAINDKFFVTVKNSQMFRNFLMAIIFEAISSKHKVFVTDEKILMKQREVFGTLQVHRVQDRNAAAIKLSEKSAHTPAIEEVSTVATADMVPMYILYKKNDQDDVLYFDVKLQKVMSSKEFTLDIGEDRIILESKLRNYLLDIYTPINVCPDKVRCCFNTVTKILTVEIPIQIAV